MNPISTTIKAGHYTANQTKIARTIGKYWPNATIREHDAGCYEAIVDSELSAVSSIMGKAKGVCYGPSRLSDGNKCYIQF